VRRTERLFAIAEYLRGRRTGVTAELLAERFGVALRTIYRDLDSLRAADLPLEAERGRGGGYALDRSYSLPPVNFTAREAALLVAAGQAAIEMRTIPFVDTLATALDKVRGALSASSQRELLELLSTLHRVGVPARPPKPEVRRVVERAWFERRRMQIVYVGSDHVESRRTVEIRQVVMDRSETILACLDVESGEERPFRIDRIVHAELAPRPA
jgi:predicted DNA-binding transcriptional regulator YafY